MTDITLAKETLNLSGASLVLARDGVATEYYGSGISPLVSLLNSDTSVIGYSAADKIIGKAAALLMVYGGIKSVYASVISIHALEVFKRYGIAFSYGKLTEMIENRSKTGYCPMEQKAIPLSLPEDAAKVFLNAGENK